MTTMLWIARGIALFVLLVTGLAMHASSNTTSDARERSAIAVRTP